jgi:GTP:adenosylcobinamide-phosphate guanylyltransferase
MNVNTPEDFERACRLMRRDSNSEDAGGP